jgi:hypothetical protein
MLLRDRIEAQGRTAVLSSAAEQRGLTLTTIRRPLAFVALVALAMAVAASRRPDAVLNPQFWAEDGAQWFAGAYNQGWLQPFLTAHTGYFQTLSRAVGALGQPLGVASAPLFFNLVALFVQILPGLFILSRRFEPAIPSLGLRCILGAVYLATPNFEVHANITNAQWHLALLAFMVIVAAPSRRWWWRLLDLSALVLCGLSGADGGRSV